MKTVYVFSSDLFAPIPSELDETDDDFINPGIFARKLAGFIRNGLLQHDYQIEFQCNEDWGIWMEVRHDRKYTLAVGCSNIDEPNGDKTRHRVFVVPDKPVIRKWFRKINVQSDVEKLVAALGEILESVPEITDISLQESGGY